MSCESVGKEAFEFLLGALKDNKSVHLNIIWSTMGFQIAALGWLVTSENARSYLAKHKKIAIAALFAIGILLIGHLSMVINNLKVSQGLVVAIRNNPFFQSCLQTSNILDSYSLNAGTVVIRLLFTIVLFSVLSMLLVSTRYDSSQKS